MKKISSTIVFFGSGPVAKSSFSYLAKHFNIEAIITKGATAQDMLAAAPDSSLYTVENKRELSELIEANLFKSKVGVIVDFGIIVERKVIDYFPLGIVNSHFSLLPQWRGADPITFAILSGQSKTGVSLMLIVEKLDEGPLLAQSALEISPTIATLELTDELVELSNKMLEVILPLHMQEELIPYEQPHYEKPSYSRKITKDDGVLDWSKSAEQLEREIRAFQEWPKSRTKLGKKDVIITKASAISLKGKPGQIDVIDKHIVVFCAKNALKIDRLKPAGKQEMTAEAFLAGYRI